MNGYYRILLASAASVLASAAVDGEFDAHGHEPGWGIRKADTGITFSAMDGRIVTVAPPRPDGGELYRSTTEAKPFVLLIADKVCTDTMSGTPYPKSVNVEIGAEKFAGCGGDPAGLLQREWTVGKIGGQAGSKGAESLVALRHGRSIERQRFLQQIFRILHCWRGRPDHFRTWIVDDDVRAALHGPREPIPGYPSRDPAFRNRARRQFDSACEGWTVDRRQPRPPKPDPRFGTSDAEATNQRISRSGAWIYLFSTKHF